MARIQIHGTHSFCSNWIFESVAERDLADSICQIAEQNGVNENDARFIFIHTLRMLKSTTRWAN